MDRGAVSRSLDEDQRRFIQYSRALLILGQGETCGVLGCSVKHDRFVFSQLLVPILNSLLEI